MQHEYSILSYPSDMSDEEWALLVAGLTFLAATGLMLDQVMYLPCAAHASYTT